MLEETDTKVSLSTVKRVLYRLNLKGRSAWKKPLLQNRHKKARLRFANAHGDKDRLFGEMSSGLMKQKCNCLAIMTIVMFGGKRGKLASRRTRTNPTVKHGGGSIMLWGCYAAGGTGARHKIDGIMSQENDVDILKQHLKTSVRKLKIGRKWVFQMDNNPRHTSKVVAKWLKDNKVKVF